MAPRHPQDATPALGFPSPAAPPLPFPVGLPAQGMESEFGNLSPAVSSCVVEGEATQLSLVVRLQVWSRKCDRIELPNRGNYLRSQGIYWELRPISEGRLQVAV